MVMKNVNASCKETPICATSPRAPLFPVCTAVITVSTMNVAVVKMLVCMVK